MPSLERLTKPLLTRIRGANAVADQLARPIEFSVLQGLVGPKAETIEIDAAEYESWVERFFPHWQSRFRTIQHKKMLEFFLSYRLLDPKSSDVFLDAAGGIDSYLPGLNCRSRYLQDITVSPALKQRLGRDIEYIESNASGIPLPSGSVDKISVHHSFEHFQADADIGFLKEVQRLLRPAGRCCIVPIFLGVKFLEITDSLSGPRRFDPAAHRVRDLTATLPGGESCGNFARVYDLEAFRRRVLESIDQSRFSLRLIEPRRSGTPLPDRSIPIHRGVALINFPYRALLIERRVP